MNEPTLHDRLASHVLTKGMDEIELDLRNSRTPFLRDCRTGEEWIDMTSFYASSALGMNHPDLIEDALFLQKLTAVAVNKPANSDYVSAEFVEFVETFQQVLGDPELPHLFLIEGGAAAVENALKIAFDWKQGANAAAGRDPDLGTKVLHLENAFHGRGGYTLSLTNTDPVKVAGFPKFPWPRIPAPAPDGILSEVELAAAEDAAIALARKAFEEHPHDIACFIAEPIQGEGGDRHLRPRFLKAIQDLCVEFEALFVLDEVQTGCGFTGSNWAYQQMGLRPDVVAFGKKVQVCGVMAGRRLDQVPGNVFNTPSRINSTWGGNLTDMVRATKILEVIRDRSLVASAAESGAILLSGLTALVEEFPDLIRNPRGRGLMCALSCHDLATRDALLAELTHRRVAILGCGGFSIRFRPPLNVDAAVITLTLEQMREALLAVRSGSELASAPS